MQVAAGRNGDWAGTGRGRDATARGDLNLRRRRAQQSAHIYITDTLPPPPLTHTRSRGLQPWRAHRRSRTNSIETTQEPEFATSQSRTAIPSNIELANTPASCMVKEAGPHPQPVAANLTLHQYCVNNSTGSEGRTRASADHSTPRPSPTCRVHPGQCGVDKPWAGLDRRESHARSAPGFAAPPHPMAQAKQTGSASRNPGACLLSSQDLPLNHAPTTCINVVSPCRFLSRGVRAL